MMHLAKFLMNCVKMIYYSEEENIEADYLLRILLAAQVSLVF